MDNMNLSDPELPARPAEKTIVGLYEEMADDKWYWRVLAFLASILIAVGFLIFGGAFMVNDSAQIVPVTIAALVVVNVGYVLSVALWFLRRNWIYQLEHIFVPCLVSSFLGLINTLVVPQLVLGSSSLTAPALASLLVSLVSTLIYGILSAFTWRRIERLRKGTRTSEQTALSYISDEELQRRQMSALLLRKEQVTAATLASQRTYHIDMPIPKGKRNLSYDAMGTIAGPTSYTL